MAEGEKRKPNKYLIRLGMAFVGIGMPVAAYLNPPPPDRQPVARAPITKLSPDEIRAEFAGLQLAMGQAIEKRIALDAAPKDEDAARRDFEAAVNGMAKHIGMLEHQAGEQLAGLYRRLETEVGQDASKERAAYKSVVGVLERMLSDRRIDLSPSREQMGR